MSAVIDKLALIYLKNRRILMTRSHGNDTWYIPGSKREKGETDIQALTREIKEELTVTLIPETIYSYGTFTAQAHGKPKGVLVKMSCYTAQFKGSPEAGSEIEAVSYQDYSVYDRLGPVDQIIFTDLKNNKLIG